MSAQRREIDTVLVGDWDGNGTVAVRHGITFYVKNSVSTGTADSTFSYGDAGDVVRVGDWDGDGADTSVVRRGGGYFGLWYLEPGRDHVSGRSADVVRGRHLPGRAPPRGRTYRAGGVAGRTCYRARSPTPRTADANRNDLDSTVVTIDPSDAGFLDGNGASRQPRSSVAVRVSVRASARTVTWATPRVA